MNFNSEELRDLKSQERQASRERSIKIEKYFTEKLGKALFNKAYVVADTATNMITLHAKDAKGLEYTYPFPLRTEVESKIALQCMRQTLYQVRHAWVRVYSVIVHSEGNFSFRDQGKLDSPDSRFVKQLGSSYINASKRFALKAAKGFSSEDNFYISDLGDGELGGQGWIVKYNLFN